MAVKVLQALPVVWLVACLLGALVEWAAKRGD
jgi:hypothetical protein